MKPDGSLSTGKAFEAQDRLVLIQMGRRHAHARLLQAHSICVCLGCVRHMDSCCLSHPALHWAAWRHIGVSAWEQQLVLTASRRECTESDVQTAGNMHSGLGLRQALERELVHADCSALPPPSRTTAVQ